MDSCSSGRCGGRCGSNMIETGWWVGWCCSDRCGSRCGSNRLNIGWWVGWVFPNLDTSYVKCRRLIFFISKILRSFNLVAPWTWRGDVQHNSIVTFGFPISPKAAFTFRITLDMLRKSLDITSNLLPIVLFWHLEMEENGAVTVYYRAYCVIMRVLRSPMREIIKINPKKHLCANLVSAYALIQFQTLKPAGRGLLS